MNQMLRAIRQLRGDDGGQDLLEYGMLAALIAVAALAAVKTLGGTIFAVFWEVIQRGF